MNWLILQSNGEHALNRSLRECYAYRAALLRLKHQATIWGPRHHTKKPDFNKFDVILCLENYNTDWVPDLRKCRPLKLFSLIDLHARSDYRQLHALTEQSDVVLHATRHLMPAYAQKFKNKKHIWFPNSVDSRYYNGAGLSAEKHSDAVFIGSAIKARQLFIEQVIAASPLRQSFLIGRHMLSAVAHARIGFNRNLNRDVNYRTFEIIGLGTCLVTDHDPDLISLGFIDGVNCLLYESASEAACKIKAALRIGSWASIAQEGFVLSRRHTYEVRITSLLESLGIKAVT